MAAVRGSPNMTPRFQSISTKVNCGSSTTANRRATPGPLRGTQVSVQPRTLHRAPHACEMASESKASAAEAAATADTSSPLAALEAAAAADGASAAVLAARASQAADMAAFGIVAAPGTPVATAGAGAGAGEVAGDGAGAGAAVDGAASAAGAGAGDAAADEGDARLDPRDVAVEMGGSAAAAACELVSFPMRGQAEMVRLLFALTGVVYRETHVSLAEWPEYSRTLRVPKLPVLFDDATCEEIGPAGAIMRRFARLTATGGANEYERTKADVVFDCAMEWRNAFDKLAYAPNWLREPTEVERYFVAAWPAQALCAKHMVMDTDSGLMVGPRITYADLAMFDFFDTITQVRPEALERYAELTAFMANVRAHPRLKAYLAKRRGPDLAGRGPAGKPVCVTGASGFLGSHLVAQLLSRGYMVHGTVRDPSDERQTKHLMALPRAEAKLKLFKVELQEADAGDALAAAFKGCGGVFLTATPHSKTAGGSPSTDELDTEAGLEAYITAGVDAVTTALTAAAAEPSVRRVVLNSSAATVLGRSLDPAHLATEADWADEEFLRSGKRWHMLARLCTERAAWKFVDELPNARRLELSVICPGTMLGPPVRGKPTASAGCRMLLPYLDGSATHVPNSCVNVVDVRDVAMAHALAFEVARAAGQRFLLLSAFVPWATVTRVLADKVPGAAVLPDAAAASADGGAAAEPADRPSSSSSRAVLSPVFFSNAKACNLGVVFSSLQRSIVDTAASLKALGLWG